MGDERLQLKWFAASAVLAVATLIPSLTTSSVTANLLNNAVLCFIENPDQLARLQAEPDLLPSAIEEVLRYRSPIQWMPRATRRDVTIHGQLIPAGKLVLPMIGSANRDPAVFEDTDRFDIHRPNAREHLSLGQGAHYCLGAPLARLEARVVLEELSEGLPSLRLVPGQTPRFQPNTTFRGPLALLVEWDT